MLCTNASGANASAAAYEANPADSIANPVIQL
jgi:hypothetical protein